MLFFFPKLVLFVALAAEIRRLEYSKESRKYFENENILKNRIFKFDMNQCFKVKRIAVLFITISLLVGKQDESCVQVCWFQRLSLYERIKLKLFFF